MYRSILIVLVVLTLGTSVVLGQEAGQPFNYRDAVRRAKHGESWAQIAREVHVAEDTLRAWNKAPQRVLYESEEVYTSDPGVDINRWCFAGGDPCGEPLRQQLFLFHVPEYVRQIWISQVEAGAPDTVMVPRGAILEELIFGKSNAGSLLKVWGLTICLWNDLVTLEPIQELPALRWPSVVYQGQEYSLLQFLICKNGGYTKDAAPPELKIEAEVIPAPEPTEPTPPPPPVVEVTPTPPETTIAPAPLEVSRNFVQNGVIWLTGEHVHLREDGRTQYNGFSGLEWVMRHHAADRVVPVLRFSPNILDENIAVNGRFGLRWNASQRKHSMLYVEGGLWLDSQQYVFRTYEDKGSGVTFWQDEREWVTGLGPYLRPILLLPKLTYVEALVRTGTTLKHEFSGQVTTEPGKAYAKLSFGRVTNKDRTAGDFHLPSDWFQAGEARLGFKPTRDFILYGSWSDWRYESPLWDFQWKGPGVGFEWRFTDAWKFHGDGKVFHDNDHDRVTGQRYTDNQTRVAIGLTYEW